MNKIKPLSIDGNGKAPRLYGIWRNMKSRCLNRNTPKFRNHGGRGITVCDQWLGYLNFHEWAINHGYNDDLTLERKDNDGNYEPSNCIWATYHQQNLNTRQNHFITYHGETKTLTEWAIILGLKYTTLDSRLIDYGWNIEKAFNVPAGKHQRRMIECRGIVKSLNEWSMEVNIPYKALHKRIFERAWDIERALTQPLRRII